MSSIKERKGQQVQLRRERRLSSSHSESFGGWLQWARKDPRRTSVIQFSIIMCECLRTKHQCYLRSESLIFFNGLQIIRKKTLNFQRFCSCWKQTDQNIHFNKYPGDSDEIRIKSTEINLEKFWFALHLFLILTKAISQIFYVQGIIDLRGVKR